MSDSLLLKMKLYNKCVEHIDQRINNIQEALDAAGESGNDETKSSAGDKHETARAMMQLEQEKSANQLSEALEIKKNILKINPNQKSSIVSLGSIVKTNSGNFYISISAGKMDIDGETYYAISPLSPIACKLIGLKVSQQFDFNGKLYKIKEIQ